ncbi:BTB/POZ domain-containing protein [Acorus gramineus]|uniref:BTB/POZ domain-containing protein n=1 Tax=Acorus gramineus TaxID=55184 RepID=A0AAV9AAJ1_ACOGR|nr:BTB/POZ domain-containing protein [Acorus gramineus]
MPPFAAPYNPTSIGYPKRTPSPPNVVTLNVGGHLFQTTTQTLTLAGPDSILSTYANPGSSSDAFIDRDPELFSVLLSLLRTASLPSKARSFDLQDLLAEARFFGLEPLLVSSLSSPDRFDPFALEPSAVLPLNGRDPPSTLSVTQTGSVHVAHGSKITSFDWSLRRRSTVLTRFPAVDSLLAISPSVAAAGATDVAGLQILSLSDGGSTLKTLNWADPTKSGSAVQAIGASPELLFSSFESCRRNASAIVAFDAGAGFEPVVEIGRREIYGAELDSAIPATKLQWVPSYNLLMAAGAHSGPSGRTGNVRLWDVRAPMEAVWEAKEGTEDCFADVAASEEVGAVFKVGVNSGEVYMVDLRKMGGWVGLGRGAAVAAGKGGKEGSGCRVECYGGHVFVSRSGDVEMWSEVVVKGGLNCGLGGDERVMRRNVIGRRRGDGAGKGRIGEMGFGGSRMVLARKGEQCVEVWEGGSGLRF